MAAAHGPRNSDDGPASLCRLAARLGAAGAGAGVTGDPGSGAGPGRAMPHANAAKRVAGAPIDAAASTVAPTDAALPAVVAVPRSAAADARRPSRVTVTEPLRSVRQTAAPLAARRATVAGAG